MYVPAPSMVQHSWYPLAFALIQTIYSVWFQLIVVHSNDDMRTQISKMILRWYVCVCCQVGARKRIISLHSRV